MANLYTPSSRMSAFFAVLFCCVTCSASLDLIASAPMAMNVTLGSVVNISCSSSDTSAVIILSLIGDESTLVQKDIITDNLKTTSALFTATANLNGTMMDCTVTSGGKTETSDSVLLLIQGPPSAPSNPAYQEIDPCSKKITWLPPFTLDGVPLFFNITITNASTQEVVDYASTEDVEYILSPIDLTETYTVHIIAWNAAGSSDEVTLEVNFATEGFAAVSNGIGRDGVTWILNFTAMNTCMSQAIANTTIKLCSESGGEQCDEFLAPKENIEQFMDGELRLSFPINVPDQRMYHSTLYVHYESGQEMRSIHSFPIDTSDILDVDVSSESNGIACFIVTQIPGSLLYGMVVKFVDTTNGNSIIRLAVLVDDKFVCIEDLPPGNYSISVGELDAPFQSIGEEVNVEAESTTITTTSTEANAECQTSLVAATLATIIVILLLLLLIFAVALLVWLRCRNKDEHKTNLNRISAVFQRDINGHDKGAQGQTRPDESDSVQLQSAMLAEPDQDEKVHVPIQVSERERSSQIYKPSPIKVSERERSPQIYKPSSINVSERERSPQIYKPSSIKVSERERSPQIYKPSV